MIHRLIAAWNDWEPEGSLREMIRLTVYETWALIVLGALVEVA